VCVAVHEILTALEPTLPEEKIQKHVRSTQYQFSVQKRGLFHVIAQAQFRQGSNIVVS